VTRGICDDGVDTVNLKGCLPLKTTESGEEASWRSAWSAFVSCGLGDTQACEQSRSLGGKKEIERVVRASKSGLFNI
jgi:hypothetical protein